MYFVAQYNQILPCKFFRGCVIKGLCTKFIFCYSENIMNSTTNKTLVKERDRKTTYVLLWYMLYV